MSLDAHIEACVGIMSAENLDIIQWAAGNYRFHQASAWCQPIPNLQQVGLVVPIGVVWREWKGVVSWGYDELSNWTTWLPAWCPYLAMIQRDPLPSKTAFWGSALQFQPTTFPGNSSFLSLTVKEYLWLKFLIIIPQIAWQNSISHQSHDTNSRNSLYVPRPKADLFKISISFAGVSLWNSLPQNIKSCISLPRFKCNLHKYMSENNLASNLDRFVWITCLPKNLSVVYMHIHERNSDVSAHL